MTAEIFLDSLPAIIDNCQHGNATTVIITGITTKENNNVETKFTSGFIQTQTQRERM